VTPDFALDHARPRGEVDLAAAAELEAALEDAIRESAGAFVIDLTGVGFIPRSRGGGRGARAAYAATLAGTSRLNSSAGSSTGEPSTARRFWA
jgi:hypothetical protein